MKNFSNKYMFIYSAALVAVVAVVLALVAMSLKEQQQTNIRNEKMQTLLKAINVESDAASAQENYVKYFKTELTVNIAGEVVTEVEVANADPKDKTRAFNIKLRDQQKLGENGAFPVYVYEKDGETGYVIPMQGNGLWGAVYANLALKADFNTVVGVTFSHDSETPGLGDKITTSEFQQQFVGKQILDENGNVRSIDVKKHADADDLHAVDAISGGTMTSNGVNAMIATDLQRYQNFINSRRGNVSSDDFQPSVETIATENIPDEDIAVEESNKEDQQ